MSCTPESHDVARVCGTQREEWDYEFDWHLVPGEEPMHMWRCRSCSSHLTGPPPSTPSELLMRDLHLLAAAGDREAAADVNALRAACGLPPKEFASKGARSIYA